MTDFLDFIRDNLYLAGLVVTIASVICAGTDTPDPKTKIGKAYKIIEILALNFGKAKK